MSRVGERIFSDDSSDSDAEICIAERVEVNYKSENCKPAGYTNGSDLLVNLPPFSMASGRTGNKAREESNHAAYDVLNPLSQIHRAKTLDLETKQMSELLESGKKFHLDSVESYKSLLASDQSLPAKGDDYQFVCKFIHSQIIFHTVRAQNCISVFTLEQESLISGEKEHVFSARQKLLGLEAEFHKDKARIYEVALSPEKASSQHKNWKFESRMLQAIVKMALIERPGDIVDTQELWSSQMNFHNDQARKYESFFASGLKLQESENQS